MRNYLPIVAFVGLTLAAGSAYAAASGTAGDLNAPPGQPSSSDVNEGTQNQNAPPGTGGANAPAADQNAPAAQQNAPTGDQNAPPMQPQPPKRHAARHHAPRTQHAATHHRTGGRTAMASRGNGPCFPLAMQFDRRLSGMLSNQAQSQKISQATDMRNKAMEACNAGRVKEGEQQLRQATAAL